MVPIDVDRCCEPPLSCRATEGILLRNRVGKVFQAKLMGDFFIVGTDNMG